MKPAKKYTVHDLAKIAHISVRTLHYYDEAGILSPAYVEKNGYRIYEEKELLRLQQILFFRELDFPLKEIHIILEDPHFDMAQALEEQRSLIELKKKRLTSLMRTIDKTLIKITKPTTNTMEDEELYSAFSKEEMEQLAEEAKQRWGHSRAYRQSQERYGKLSKEEKLEIGRQADALMKEMAASMPHGPESKETQKLIGKHYDNLRRFYEPSLEMYRGLAEMYLEDTRFERYFEPYAPGMTKFMRDAMLVFCNTKKK